MFLGENGFDAIRIHLRVIEKEEGSVDQPWIQLQAAGVEVETDTGDWSQVSGTKGILKYGLFNNLRVKLHRGRL